MFRPVFILFDAMKIRSACPAVLLAGLFLPAAALLAQEDIPSAPATNAWALAAKYRDVHRFSTLFTAQDVRRYLSGDSGIDDAIAWCRQTGVTKVYIETFRDGYQAEHDALEHARTHFETAGFEVAGCVTTTRWASLRPGGTASLPAITIRPRKRSLRRFSPTQRACSTKS